jgi:hypothetical protein
MIDLFKRSLLPHRQIVTPPCRATLIQRAYHIAGCGCICDAGSGQLQRQGAKRQGRKDYDTPPCLCALALKTPTRTNAQLSARLPQNLLTGIGIRAKMNTEDLNRFYSKQ